VRCDATTMQSVQTGDRPTKLSQMFKSARRSKLWALGTMDELTWSHTMRSSAPPAATADALKRCGKHNSIQGLTCTAATRYQVIDMMWGSVSCRRGLLGKRDDGASSPNTDHHCGPSTAPVTICYEINGYRRTAWATLRGVRAGRRAATCID
jgi:hypothetical protein